MIRVVLIKAHPVGQTVTIGIHGKSSLRSLNRWLRWKKVLESSEVMERINLERVLLENGARSPVAPFTNMV